MFARVISWIQTVDDCRQAGAAYRSQITENIHHAVGAIRERCNLRSSRNDQDVRHPCSNCQGRCNPRMLHPCGNKGGRHLQHSLLDFSLGSVATRSEERHSHGKIKPSTLGVKVGRDAEGTFLRRTGNPCICSTLLVLVAFPRRDLTATPHAGIKAALVCGQQSCTPDDIHSLSKGC